ncbi:hypothetical protein GQ457_12G027560 [Hibiscus cannabinus]
MELPIVLERPGSPTALEDQRNSKKSTGFGTEQGVIVIGDEDMVMDTEVEVVPDGSHKSDPKNNGDAPQQGVPAIGKSSYASVVSQGRGRPGSGMGEDVLDPNSVIVLDEDCVISESGDYPSIKFSARVHDQIDRSMRNVVIVRLLGLRLEDMRDYEVVIVWVRLSGLPYRYYCKALFRRIAQVVGKVVKVDYNTQAGERGKFARLAITVDLNKPLTPCIGIDNFVQKLEYEGLNLICFACGKYGHSREVCSLNPVSNDEAAAIEVNNHSSDRVPNKSELYGPWMVVKDRRHRIMFSKSSRWTSADVGGEANGSRFAVLSEVQNGDRMAVRGIGSDAYRNSSPARRSKVTGNMISMDSSLDVIPLVGGSSIAITSHALHNTPGSHRAISIQETSGKDKGARFDDRHVGRGKGIREVNPRGVRIQKAVGVSSPNRVLLYDWVQTTSQQIEAEVDSNRGKGVGGGIMEEDGREAISIQQAPRSDASFLGDMNYKDKGGGSGVLPLTDCFFALDFKQWLYLNLTNDGNFAWVSLNWNLMFGSLLWCIWCRWNDGIFGTATIQAGSVLQRGLRMQQEAVAVSVRGAAGAGRVATGVAVLNRSWCVWFSHIVRDGNHAADWMAKLASSDDLLCHRYLSPPASISVLLQQDAAD